jgi:phage terminase Nu1 subunit (DNA packaging protein)
MARVTEREAAKALDCSRAKLQEARKRGDLVRSVSRDAKGRLVIDVEVARVELAEAAALRVTAKGEADETLQRWRSARARLAEAQAAQAEEELRLKRGRLVEVDEVRSEWVKLVTRSRNRLLALPSKIRQRLPNLTHAEVALIDGLVREALSELGGDGLRAHLDEAPKTAEAAKAPAEPEAAKGAKATQDEAEKPDAA